MQMDDEWEKETICVGVAIVCLFFVFIFILMTIKICDTQDRIERLEEKMTEKTLEQPTTQVTTEIVLPKEPSDDKIVISVGWE